MAYAFVAGGVLAGLAKTSAELNFGNQKGLANGCAPTPPAEGAAPAAPPAGLRPLGGTISIIHTILPFRRVSRGAGTSDRGLPLRSAPYLGLEATGRSSNDRGIGQFSRVSRRN